MKRGHRHLARSAFTMMEVLVVIVILAILLALMTTIVKRVLVTADIEKTKAVQELIMSAVMRYHDEKNVYPNSLDDLRSVPSCAELLSNTVAIQSGGIVTDGFDKTMTYSKDGGIGGGPRLTSAGPDGVIGNKDDIIKN